MSTPEFFVEARGRGPAVVFTHGFGRAGDTWSRQTNALAGDHHVVAWDLRGHGRSPVPPGLYTREEALADLAAVVDAAVAESGGPALLVGHSLGGYLSLAHTLARPETVRGLALLSTGPGFRNPESREQYNRGIAKVAAASGLPANVGHVAVQQDSMIIDRLDEIICPAVLICGADDRPVYLTGARYLAERLATATLIEVEGAAHEPHLDRPDEVTAALRAHEALLAGR
ncbi:MAG TPA: alpha/beta fold hydrolase [Acidimicrobiia bacterium]|jgi:pimeloyl-ACP methyl ester carboxylesterase|nr:alpha/beta fold hydrolase [Acidimicrobiia bacterium]